MIAPPHVDHSRKTYNCRPKKERIVNTMPEKKRKYTFRKGQPIPYESGSPIHVMEKTEREAAKRISQVLGDRKTKKRRVLRRSA